MTYYEFQELVITDGSLAAISDCCQNGPKTMKYKFASPTISHFLVTVFLLLITTAFCFQVKRLVLKVQTTMFLPEKIS